MGIWSQGRVAVTPMTINSRASLEDLVRTAKGLLYDVRTDAPGWGGFTDDPWAIGEPGAVAITPGTPTSIAADEYSPDHLVGRIYWREVDRKALRILNADGRERKAQVLRAIDVMIAKGAQERELHVFAGTRNARELNNIVDPVLRELVSLADKSGSVRTSQSPLDLGGGDIFRWMLHRSETAPEVSTALTISDMHSLTGRDALYRGTAWRHGARLDRPDLLASLAGAGNNYGPAGIVVEDSDLDLSVDFIVEDNGAFSPKLGESVYGDIPRRTDVMGPQLVRDLAFKVIPELRTAYNQDSDWPANGRDIFTARVRKNLAQFAGSMVGGTDCALCERPLD